LNALKSILCIHEYSLNSLIFAGIVSVDCLQNLPYSDNAVLMYQFVDIMLHENVLIFIFLSNFLGFGRPN
jgi:hypothetical protein